MRSFSLGRSDSASRIPAAKGQAIVRCIIDDTPGAIG
jgi:hypothetical protein